MKTLTEFSGFALKDAMAKKTALLAEGKTEEEAQAAINEFLKLDETKAPFYINAIDMTNSRMDRVKRVVVAIRATETEKVPEAFSEREGHFYLVEFFPSADSRAPARGGREDDRFSRGRGGSGGGGRGREGGGRGDDSRGRRPEGGDRQPPREPRPDSGLFAKNTGLPSTAPRDGGLNKMAGERRPRPEGRPARAPRPPRPEGEARGPRPARGPKGAGELRLVLKGQSTTLQGSGPATPEADATTTPAAETPQA